MSILEIDVGDLRAAAVEFTTTELIVTLADGRKIVTPLDWYPRLQHASAAERAFLDVQSVGVYLEKDVLTPDTTVFVFDDFRLSYVVPEPMSCLMGLAGAFLVVQRRRLRRG